jgi:hypothetical protein
MNDLQLILISNRKSLGAQVIPKYCAHTFRDLIMTVHTQAEPVLVI